MSQKRTSRGSFVNRKSSHIDVIGSSPNTDDITTSGCGEEDTPEAYSNKSAKYSHDCGQSPKSTKQSLATPIADKFVYSAENNQDEHYLGGYKPVLSGSAKASDKGQLDTPKTPPLIDTPVQRKDADQEPFPLYDPDVAARAGLSAEKQQPNGDTHPELNKQSRLSPTPPSSINTQVSKALSEKHGTIERSDRDSFEIFDKGDKREISSIKKAENEKVPLQPADVNETALSKIGKKLNVWRGLFMATLVLLVGSLVINIVQYHYPFKIVNVKVTKELEKPPAVGLEGAVSYAQDPDVLVVMNDTRLHQVFYGMNYSPSNVEHPTCGVTLKQVTRDIAILAQLTKRVRLYGTECLQADMVLTAINDLGVDMTVTVGVWVDRFLENTLRQFNDLRRILDQYSVSRIDAVMVGNEALFRNDVREQELTGFIEYVQEYVRRKGLGKLPVGTSEVGGYWTKGLANHVDVIAANVHPFFGGVNVNASTKWTYDYMMSDVLSKRPGADKKQQSFMISEVGWPTAGGNLDDAYAGIVETQYFLDTWVCQNQDPAIGWYWFEAFDQPWKATRASNGPWEPHWGLFDHDRNLKNLTIPVCN